MEVKIEATEQRHLLPSMSFHGLRSVHEQGLDYIRRKLVDFKTILGTGS